MATSSRSYEFISAVRGFHVCRQEWHPEQNEELGCSHEVGNVFAIFAIKTTNNDGGVTGHLPQEISRPTKFLLDRGAQITAILTDTHYRRSPLFQGDLEIPCLVKDIYVFENIRRLMEKSQYTLILCKFLPGYCYQHPQTNYVSYK